MTSKKEVEIEIDHLSTFKTIMEAYEEIAAFSMQKIRSSVIQSRDFLLEINSVFQQVKFSYKKELEQLLKKKKIRDKNRSVFVRSNGKTLLVLLSSNTGLYGDIVKKTYDLFALELQKVESDIAIIGKIGLKFFQEQFPKKLFTYFELPDDKLDFEVLKKIAEYLIQYEKIIIFYGQFQSIISQKPIATSISGDRLPQHEISTEIKYFFEPTLPIVMEFFEKEILKSIFEQTVFESQLAKFASRMVSLDSATENTKSLLRLMTLKKEKIKHQTMNKKQNALFATRRLWQDKFYG